MRGTQRDEVLLPLGEGTGAPDHVLSDTEPGDLPGAAWGPQSKGTHESPWTPSS